MRLLLLDPFSGASGDMFLGGLLGLGVDQDALLQGLRSLQEPGWRLEVSEVLRAGLAATRVRVLLDAAGGEEERRGSGLRPVSAPPEPGHGHGRSPRSILQAISASGLPEPAKDLALRAFRELADAEARVHGTTLEQVHFHEVGATDAVVDVCGTALALHLLGGPKVYSQPVATGRGMVRTAHGHLPVPAPATLELLRDLPVRPGLTESELLTPTGAALLRALGPTFTSPPPCRLQQWSFGAGRDDHPKVPNVLRMVLAETWPEGSPDEVLEINFEVDDMTPEALGHLRARLPAPDVLDLSITACLMKKDRPGHRITLLAPPGALDRLEEAIFLHTTTFGFRVSRHERRVLEREIVRVDSSLGPCRVKIGRHRGKVVRLHPEPEDVAALAERHQLSFAAVDRRIREAARSLAPL